jgi:hypothetical protein
MTRLALFNYLVKTNSYNGLIAFSESLEKEKDYLLSDNVLEYVKVAHQKHSLKMITVQQISEAYAHSQGVQ